MGLLKEYVRRELDQLVEHDIRLRVLGRMEDLPPDAQEELRRGLERTAGNGGLEFNIALSYGGRTEIVDACRALLREGISPDEVDTESFARRLYTAGLPDPDLLIRTSGELRISNFLLWQIAYAEIWVTPTLWPDFRRRHLLRALVDFQHRERRYGGIAADEESSAAAVVRS
jgi:undecaprenyl diphosphate synthase